MHIRHISSTEIPKSRGPSVQRLLHLLRFWRILPEGCSQRCYVHLQGMQPSDLSGVPNSSFMVRSIARHCVGCVVSVRPFHTGIPLYSASTSAYLCSNPRNSIPSNILPSTRAVSSILSLSPNWISLPARYVGIPPSSCAPTVNAHLVLVDGFSKIRQCSFLPGCVL